MNAVKLVHQEEMMKLISIVNLAKIIMYFSRKIALKNVQKNIMKSINIAFFVINYVKQQELIAMIVQVVLMDIIYYKTNLNVKNVMNIVKHVKMD
jgi:hypothetical protein